MFATEYEDRFIGWIHILVTPKIGKWKKGHLFVDEMWVMPDYRRKGVAICMRNMAWRQSVNVFSWKNPVIETLQSIEWIVFRSDSRST